MAHVQFQETHFERRYWGLDRPRVEFMIQVQLQEADGGGYYFEQRKMTMIG